MGTLWMEPVPFGMMLLHKYDASRRLSTYPFGSPERILKFFLILLLCRNWRSSEVLSHRSTEL